MPARLRRSLSFANVVSMLALFIALTGGAYALTLPRASVGPKQLKRNAVTGPKIKRGAVTSRKVKDHSLLAKDFKADQLPAGPGGPQGPQGEQGPAGTDPSTCTTAAGSCTLIGAKNVVGARRSPNNPTGFYCVTTGPGIDPNADGFMSGVVWDFTNNPEGDATAMVMDDPPPAAAQVCPGDFTVVTERSTDTTAADFATNVGFWFAVP
jgi:hypothetical protein